MPDTYINIEDAINKTKFGKISTLKPFIKKKPKIIFEGMVKIFGSLINDK